jgi:hypothetical protein
MMRKGVSCKEISVAFGVIHSFPISLEEQNSSQASIEYGSNGSISKTHKVSSPSVLSQTMRLVESIYRFSDNSSYQKVFILTQEDMFALVFSCLSESDVLLIP